MDINGAVDIRLKMKDFQDVGFMLHGVELNIKSTYADQTNDRLIFALQIPYSPHWKSDMFFYHYGDAYAIVKGSLGKPNVKIGRFDIPFGLIKNFDSHTALLPLLFEKSLEIKKDIGADIFGYYKMLTYDISFTQGFNRWETPRNDRPITARIGFDNDEIKYGISYYNSTHAMNGKMRMVGVDIEKNINPLILRAEAMIGDYLSGKGLNVMIDFPVFFGIEGRGSGLLWKDNFTYQSYGLELRKEISFLSIAAGFIHSREIENINNVVLQTIVRL